MSNDEGEVARKKRECQQMADVDHQGIVRYHHSHICKQHPFPDHDVDDDDDDELNKAHNYEQDSSLEILPSPSESSIEFLEGSQSSTPNTSHLGQGHFFLCIQMELCGESLTSYLKADACDVDPLQTRKRYLKIFCGIVDAMSYMHERGLIHRDLKPDNIFRSLKAPKNHNDPPVFKIGDWGSVKRDNPDQTSFQLDLKKHDFSDYFGTHGFAAPEVLTKALYSCMVDIFSMGKILLYLLFPK